MNEYRRTKIGFIGLGLMGSAMVQRLQALGYPLNVVAHRQRASIDAAVGQGAVELQTPGEVTAASEIVMLCVDNSNSVEAIMRGENGVLSTLDTHQLVIDFGTSLPSSTTALAASCRDQGAAMMDAPLGRTPAHAVDGLLNIMAAGTPEDFARVKPILEDLGEHVFYVGPVGSGHTLKIINNFFAMTTACAMSEAFAMADRAGLTREMLYEVMAAGPNKSGMMDFIKAAAVDGKPEQLAFSIGNGRKDVGYYTKMAGDLHASSFIAPSVESVLNAADTAGWGDRYVSEMVDFIAGTLAHD
ncbi:MAG: NAD(P)-dependent oxidoreductase [Desulfofustis sp. PB-SRB1]|jgi:3-hydroxyisobutyrate dehydrogenase-like beta-hydroxyacid dehydrogenase|nr:NAD(P)-dependent oxidoreductase [Desulfofustis sp. PB-SRB1]MBM1002401.1 NAD(P)-dependent oxidoreductase [Desulfofustis sp. PB-SRB1]HBH29521.1 NAD(P)-dependent oxidoreductase [Desulfofustis sp.]HBH31769.1 NAD(P)-dependent oxidoreductase [Desulfofustis sp.]